MIALPMETISYRQIVPTRNVAPRCATCNRDFAAGEPVYQYRHARYRVGRRFVSGHRRVCKSCFDQAARARTVMHYPDRAIRCGGCDRPMFVPWIGSPHRMQAFCCAPCQWTYQGHTRREARTLEDRPCQDCGATFTPKRKDSIYCSAACKQRAYRRRVQP
jgi:hypothetical protein